MWGWVHVAVSWNPESLLWLHNKCGSFKNEMYIVHSCHTYCIIGCCLWASNGNGKVYYFGSHRYLNWQFSLLVIYAVKVSWCKCKMDWFMTSSWVKKFWLHVLICQILCNQLANAFTLRCYTKNEANEKTPAHCLRCKIPPTCDSLVPCWKSNTNIWSHF